MSSIKCVTVGDERVGKTWMLFSYVNGYTPEQYIPTIFDVFSSNIEVDGKETRLELWDLAGLETYDRYRPLAYPCSDVALVCFSVVTPTSFENIQLKWIPEIKHFCPETKIILVGTKCDSRDNPQTLELLKTMNETPVTYTQGLLLATRIGAVKYVECCSLTQFGLTEVFDAAAESVFKSPTPV